MKNFSSLLFIYLFSLIDPQNGDSDYKLCDVSSHCLYKSAVAVYTAGVNSSASVMHSISAKLVRVEPAAVHVVLSVESSELTDFMDAYGRGFAAEPPRYPDDGGIRLHNPDLCRRTARSVERSVQGRPQDFG